MRRLNFTRLSGMRSAVETPCPRKHLEQSMNARPNIMVCLQPKDPAVESMIMSMENSIKQINHMRDTSVSNPP